MRVYNLGFRGFGVSGRVLGGLKASRVRGV